MRLQFAMDTLTTESALDLAAKAAPYVDILELGTPLIKSEGLAAITAVKAAHPDKTVFADLKTMDAGELEADIAFSAGADLVTVLGVAGDSTIAGAVAARAITDGFGLPAALGLSLATGIACGLWNGFLVAVLKIQPIVATLILMVAGRGIAQLVTEGAILTFNHPGFAFLGSGAVGTVPVPVLVTAAGAGAGGAVTVGV